MDGVPSRRKPAHPPPVERHNQPLVLFLTVCLADKRVNLASGSLRQSLVAAWGLSDQWCVGWYMLMPDHVHFFCVPGVLHPVNVKMWCKYWKGQLRRIEGYDGRIWQRDCWDTQMRDADHYMEKRSYVALNPVRKGLVEHADEWPFQGELHTIRW